LALPPWNPVVKWMARPIADHGWRIRGLAAPIRWLRPDNQQVSVARSNEVMSKLALERAAAAAVRRVLGGAGTDIVRQREDAGLMRSELARAANVDPSYLRRIESGVVSPSVET
jgi:ribosome-binding protein aMBF1 (putative translation factor)